MIHFLLIIALLFGVPMLLVRFFKSPETRLFSAITHGQCETVEKMLNANPQLAAESKAVVWAVRHNQQPICELLIQHGCDLRSRATELLLAAAHRPQMLRFVIEKGADPKAIAKDGFTPLHAAAIVGNIESIQILHNHGANLEAVYDPWQATPLKAAACGGRLEAVDFLLSLGANPNNVDLANGLPRFKAPFAEPERLKACEERIREAQK